MKVYANVYSWKEMNVVVIVNRDLLYEELSIKPNISTVSTDCLLYKLKESSE